MDPFAHARPNWSQSPLNEGSSSQGSAVPLAATAPVLKCYEEAVQEPMVECLNIDSLYTQAQLDGSDRIDARILREDFCSTAIIATTWLSLDAKNQSQGVDIDLVALKDTYRRLKNKEELAIQLLQSPGFGGGDYTRDLSEDVNVDAAGTADDGKQESVELVNGEQSEHHRDTWTPGAATERFDRKRNKKLAKAAKKASDSTSSSFRQSAAAKTDPVTPSEEHGSSRIRMKLLHSDVLNLPAPPVAVAGGESTKSPRESPSTSKRFALEPPDVIASLNYAMAYFHDRATLIRYLKMAKDTLRPNTGVFITDMFGGPSTGESYPNQDETWARFQNEIGFGRDGGDGRNQQVLLADRPPKQRPRKSQHGTKAGEKSVPLTNGSNVASTMGDSDDEEPEKVLEVMDAPPSTVKGTRAEWPRGKLKLVRTGSVHGGFEYWREDGPVDWMTNRFRMSLSFRFSDASWLRDVFWYDFRVWSIKELTEAMEEVGFVRVKVHILPRNIVDDDSISELNDRKSDAGDSDEGENDDDGGLADMAKLMRRTEKEERNKSYYRALKPGEKVFATRSFGTYIIACAP